MSAARHPPQHPARRRLTFGLVLAPLLPLVGGPAQAHGTRAGDLLIDHPYAPPTPPGARTGAVYFRLLRNLGAVADRLLSARSAVAASVEMHRSTMDGNVMRMRALPALELPAGAELPLRHGGDTHLMLVDLKAPLVEGQRFALWLRFERAGEHEVVVWVQTPRGGAGHRH